MITSITGWASMTAEQILAHLLETETVPNPQTVITATLIENLGPDAARVVLGSMQSVSSVDPIVGAAYQALVTVGITLHQPDRLAMIDALAAAASWPPELTAAVKALGVTTRPRWQSLGYASEPTLQRVTDEVDAARTFAWYEAKDAVVRERLQNLTTTTREQIREIMGAE